MAVSKEPFEPDEEQRVPRLTEAEALAEISRRISTSLDLGDVLRGVVDAAWRLVRADFANIALPDERGALLVAAMVGHRTREFLGLVIPPGIGVGGYVMRSGLAYQVGDYLREGAIVHDPGVDAVVAAEGAMAALALPILRGREPIGVFWVGSRSPRRFTPAEVALLERLAAQAAVAVHNARVYAAEQATRAAAEAVERRYRSLVQNASDIFAVLDTDGRVRYISPSVERILGYSPQQLEGQDPFPLVHPEDTERAVSAFRGVLAQPGVHGPLEFRFRHADGSWRYLETTANNLLADPDVQGTVLNVRDTTERKRAEEEKEALLEQLRVERARLEAVLAQLPEGVLIADAGSGRIVLHNQQADDLLGFNAEADFTSPALKGFDAAGRPYAPGRWPLRRSLHTGEAITNEEIEIERKDGSRVWLSVNSAPIRRHDGIIAAVATFREISERRRAEQAQRMLAESGRLLAGSLDFDTTLESIARLIVPAVADWCVIDLLEGDRVRRAVVVPADPAKNTWAQELREHYPVALDVPENIVVRVVRSGRPDLRPQVTDELLQRAARDARHLQILRGLGIRSHIIAPLAARGRTLGAITLVAAESGRVYTPQDLELIEDVCRRAGLAIDNARLYRSAQEALSIRDGFLSLASHELRTPLTSLKGNLELVQRRLQRGQGVESIAGPLERAALQTERLIGLVRDLLDVARISSGHLEIERAPVDLGALVSRIVELERSTEPGRTIVLEAPAVAVVIEADEARLEQVLVNLLENARKYSPEQQPVRVVVQARGGAAVVSVEDRGIGIPPEELERIFERFHRASNIDRRSFSGLGLGLHIARQIVEAHGGALSANSTPGQGSTFTLTLPLATG